MKLLLLGLLICGSVFAQEFPLELVSEFTMPTNMGFDVQFWMNEGEVGWASSYRDTITYQLTLDSPVQTYVVPDTLGIERIALMKIGDDPGILLWGRGELLGTYPDVRMHWAIGVNLTANEVAFSFSPAWDEDERPFGYDTHQLLQLEVLPALPAATQYIVYSLKNDDYYEWGMQEWESLHNSYVSAILLSANPMDIESVGRGSKFGTFRNTDTLIVATCGTSEYAFSNYESGFHEYNGYFGVATPDSTYFQNSWDCLDDYDLCAGMEIVAQSDADGTKRVVRESGIAYNAESGDSLWSLGPSVLQGHQFFTAILDSTGNERICVKASNQFWYPLDIYDAANGAYLGRSTEIPIFLHVLKPPNGHDCFVTMSSAANTFQLYRSALIDAARPNPQSSLPQAFALTAYPNPFNPTTTISFALPAASETSVTVINLLGQTVEQVDLGLLTAGSHEYVFDASALPSGIYFAKVSTPTQAKVKKLLLTK